MKIIPFAVSSRFNEQQYEQGAQWLLQNRCEILSNPILRIGLETYLNGSDEERLRELQRACSEERADAIWAVRGGYGMTRLLPMLKDCEPVAPIVGFSDTTALMMHFWALHGLKSLHAPLITQLSEESAESSQALLLALNGQARDVAYPSLSLRKTYLKDRIRGTLLAANLSMLVELLGTRSMPSLCGTILVLEDVGEKPYRLDRMLTHLWAAGALKGIQAIVLGYLTDCGDEPFKVFEERCQSFEIPLLTGLPVGHEQPNWPVPIGVEAEIQLQSHRGTLKVLEEVFPSRLLFRC
ncbi:MAG: LD-carboxypeptidase [Myxococcaceae bacterium]|nr:LD-carboxypeptidase [Myxococcaceae bacterium]MBH2006085.1 LD-carboxypeptidase [Myxococcaceae bacterium]